MCGFLSVSDVLLNPGHVQAKDCCPVAGPGCNVKSVRAFYRCQFWWGHCHQNQPCSFWNPSETELRVWVTPWAILGGNCCQSSDSFSALGTLLLHNRVANAHTQWDFPLQARRWRMLKKLCSYTISAFNSNMVLWPFTSTRSILGEIRTNPQSFHGKEKSFVVWRLSYDKIMEVPFLQD